MGKLVLKRRIKLVLKRRIHESQLLLAQLKRNQFLFTKNTKNNCESWLPFSCTHSTSKLHWGRIAITDKIAHYVRWGTQGVRRGTKLWWWSDATGWPQNCLRLQTGVCACCCACARVTLPFRNDTSPKMKCPTLPPLTKCGRIKYAVCYRTSVQKILSSILP